MEEKILPLRLINKLCEKLTGNLDMAGKFSSASSLKPGDLYIAKYNPYYIENLKNPSDLADTLKRLKHEEFRGIEKVLFIGKPRMGKTRSVYEKIIRELKDFIVFFPSESDLCKVRMSSMSPMPFMDGAKLILFLDDLDKFVSRSEIDLRRLISRLQDGCQKLLVAATLRTGNEMTDMVMTRREGRELIGEFKKIEFKEIDRGQADEIAKKLCITKFEYDGTPGGVVLGLDEMRHRLEALGLNERAVCKTLKLLMSPLIYEPEMELVKAVSDGVFHTNFESQRMAWDDCVKRLITNDLVVRHGDTLKAPHGDYYNSVYDPQYRPGKNDLNRLQDIFADKKDVSGLVDLGASFDILLRDYGRAIQSYDKAIEIDPKNVLAWYNRGNSLDELGRHEEAVKSYDKAIAIDSKNVSAWVNRGNSLRVLGRHKEAVESCDRAIEIDPKDVRAWVNRGNRLRELGRHEEAVESYDRAIEIDPSFFPALFNKALYLHKIGRTQEAKECIKRAREIEPNLPEPQFMNE